MGFRRLMFVPVALTAVALASCGGDEGYPPFEMTYTLGTSSESLSTWRLEYRATDDWTKTLVATERQGPFDVGRTARWDGDRIEWAESADGPFVRDQSPEPSPVHAFPERWFGYTLSEVPNEFWEEVDAPRAGTRRFRNEFTFGGDPPRTATEVVTFDVETGLPIEYEMRDSYVFDERFEVVELALQ